MINKIYKAILVAALVFVAGVSVNAQTITQTFGTGANQFSIDFVTIGNPGNASDTMGSPNPVGSVSYIYNLGKYEISRDQVGKANTAGGLGITLADLTSYGGNSSSRPATGISWNEAARFVNYLNTSQGYQAAYNFTTTGANDNITLWGTGQYSGSNQYRHKDAYYFLPSVDEWYKGAYGSASGTWSKYPNGSDNAPNPVSGGTSGAVYGPQSSPANVTNAGGLSPYGTMAQGGNVYEWTETSENGAGNGSRWYRGGSFNSGSDVVLKSNNQGSISPTTEHYSIGFRVASALVPEPSSASLLMAGIGGLLALRWRRKS